MNNETKYNLLLPKYQHLLNDMTYKFAPTYLQEDYKQASLLGFYKAIKTYRKNKGALTTWIFYKVRKEFQDVARLKNHSKLTYYTQMKLGGVENALLIDYCDTESNSELRTEFEFNEIYTKDEHELAMTLMASCSRYFKRQEVCIIKDRYINNKSYQYLAKKYRRSNDNLKNIFEKFEGILQEKKKIILGEDNA